MIFSNYFFFFYVFINFCFSIFYDYKQKLTYNNLYTRDLIYNKNYKNLYLLCRCYFNGNIYSFFLINFVYLFRIVKINNIHYIFDIFTILIHLSYIFFQLYNNSFKYSDLISIYSFHCGYLNLRI